MLKKGLKLCVGMDMGEFVIDCSKLELVFEKAHRLNKKITPLTLKNFENHSLEVISARSDFAVVGDTGFTYVLPYNGSYMYAID